MERIKIPMKVEFLLNKLHDAGYEAYIVGGCVRDSIMGVVPHDWDICTSALPEQVIEVFKDYNVVLTGLKHGTVTVILEPTHISKAEPFEITTYRIDGEYKDNRHPENVKFVSDLSLDLMRRDFTINAMAYNHRDGLVDLYGGIEDIHDRIIRCVGNPDDRFQEDALRIIRTIRFALRFGFDIDLDTYESMQRNKSLLKNVSAERICSELTKIIETADFGDTNIKITECLLDLIDTYTENPINRDIQLIRYQLERASIDVPIGLAVIFDDDNIEEILKQLRFSNDVINAAVAIRNYGHKILRESHIWATKDNIQSSISNNSVDFRYYARKLLNEITSCPIECIIEFAELFCKDNQYMRIALSMLESQVRTCRNNYEVYKISYLAINGNDLIELGYKGKEIGEILNSLLDKVMREEVRNTKQDLIAAINMESLNGL